MGNKPVFILGSGGHGKVVIDAILCSRPSSQVFLFDNSPKNSSVLGHIVSKGYPWEEANNVAKVHIAVGSNSQRKHLGSLALENGVELETVIHPTAHIGSGVSIGQGCFIGPHAVLNPNCKVGMGTIVNSGAIVEHDCDIGTFSHLAPGAVVAGGVVVGNNCFLGANSVVKEGITIAPGVVIGAITFVNKDIQGAGTFFGVPAQARNN